MDSLRETVEELTATVQALETDQLQKKAEAQRKKSTGDVARQTMWKKIARRQLEKRRKAEQDNATLRMMLKMQVEEAKSLTRILKRRQRIEELEAMTGVKKLKALADSDSEGDIPALQAMLSKTDELYVQVDKVFEQKKMDAVDCPGKRKSINRHANNDVFLEMSEKQLLPFDSKATEKAVWAAVEDIGLQGLQCIKDVDAQIQFHAQHRQETNNTMMISHIVATTGFEKGGFTSGFAYLNRKVARKFVEQDRSVFICTISSHPTLDTPYSCKFGCTLRVIVRSMGEDISLVESYYSVSSHIPANDRAMTSEEFDVVIAGWSEMMQIFTESVESYLLNGNKDALG
ncbi:hypothetical protein PHMEG_00015120 [Phytophthora megakarya]|uniref:M96 mating-specific protein n=1 Tax=Phytophthora megakarya TaxID=4795 RepID=A0A225W3N0_9STRA|nr:hypothetical protein PHMEG_00015120 [Phytophthora megakarya]